MNTYAKAYGGQPLHDIRSASTYDYSNSARVTEALAAIYARYALVDHVSPKSRARGTLEEAAQNGVSDVLYYCKTEGFQRDDLFRAWIAEQPPSCSVFFVADVREAALMLTGLTSLGFSGQFREVTRPLLTGAIAFDLYDSPLDECLRAAAGLVTFRDYIPEGAVVVLSSRGPDIVQKARGVTAVRADCKEKPFVLLDRKYWLFTLLESVLREAGDTAQVKDMVREICNLVVVQVALSNRAGLRKEAIESINRWLKKLYVIVSEFDDLSEHEAVQGQKMVVLAELLGQG